MGSNIPLSNWDDPFGEEPSPDQAMPIITLPGKTRPLDVKLIRNRQQKMLPYLQELYKAACDELSRQGAAARLASEREVLKVVEYRIPDHPHLMQIFTHASTDFAVVMPAKKHKGDPFFNKIAPMQHVDQLKGQGDMALLMKLENLGLEQSPGMVRVVFPGLINFLSFWIMKVDGPIRRVIYNQTTASKPFRDFNYSNLIH